MVRRLSEMPIQVGAYYLRVRERYTKNNEILESIQGSVDFLDFLTDTLETCKTAHHNDIASERIALTERVEVRGRVIQGRIEVGDYGRASNVRNAADARTVFRKNKNHADALSLFFRIQVPEGRDEALLLIEKTRQTSGKTAFMALLRYHFKNVFDAFSLLENPVLPEGVFKEYFQTGNVQKISFIKMGIPSDAADMLASGHEELAGKTEFIIQAPRNRYFTFKASVLTSRDPIRQIQDLYELEDFEYENIRVAVKVGKSLRTIDLGTKHVLPVYDITDRVQVGKDGNPIYESMSAALDALAIDIESGAYAAA